MGSKVRPVIVHIVNTLEGGGTERTLVNMLSRWRHEDFDHRVVTLRAAGSLASKLPSQVACCAIGAIGRSRTSWFKLAGVLRKWRADVVHVRNTSCWIDATLASLLLPNGQLVLGFHGLDSATHLPGRIASVAKFALRTGAVFSSVSMAGQQKLKLEADISEQKITVIRNGVNSTQYKPPTFQQKQDARHHLGLDDREFVVGSVGSLTPVKNQQLLLEAFASIIEAGYRAKLLIVGEGPLRETLTNKARQLGIDQYVHLDGESDSVISWLHAMDVYVCSSHSESLSNSLLEAMSAGLPIITTNVGDHAWVLSNEKDGLIVPSGNTKALTTALARVCANTTYRLELGNQARTRATAFDIKATLAAYEQYYKSLTRQHSAGFPKNLAIRLIKTATNGPVINHSRAETAIP